MKNQRKKPDATPEQVAKMTNFVINNLSDKFAIKPPNELEVLATKRNTLREEVRTLVRPIVQLAINDGSAHTELGRMQLLVTCHKIFLDKLVHWDREEIIFSLAFMMAERTVEDLV